MPILGEGLSEKTQAWLFRGTWGFSVGLKIKPLQISVFLC